MSYDAMTAHTAIVFARYMMIAVEQRRSIDDRSFGGMFYTMCEELQDMQYIEALGLLMRMLVSTIRENVYGIDKKLDMIPDEFLGNLPDMWSRCLKQCA